jgi:hypothetical protein
MCLLGHITATAGKLKMRILLVEQSGGVFGDRSKV